MDLYRCCHHDLDPPEGVFHCGRAREEATIQCSTLLEVGCGARLEFLVLLVEVLEVLCRLSEPHSMTRLDRAS